MSAATPMRSRACALAVALTALAPASAIAARTPLKVQTQNVYGAHAADFADRAQTIAAEIAAETPDVVALQQVDDLATMLVALGDAEQSYLVGALSPDGAVILVRNRDGLSSSNPQHGTGWASIDGVVGTKAFHFVDAQNATEPVSPTPAIVAGEVDPLPQDFTDVWGSGNQGPPGFTCCQAPDLGNAQSQLSERADFVLTRGTRRGPARAHVVADRTASGVWASDHAGVVATVYP